MSLAITSATQHSPVPVSHQLHESQSSPASGEFVPAAPKAPAYVFGKLLKGFAANLSQTFSLKDRSVSTHTVKEDGFIGYDKCYEKSLDKIGSYILDPDADARIKQICQNEITQLSVDFDITTQNRKAFDKALEYNTSLESLTIKNVCKFQNNAIPFSLQDTVNALKINRTLREFYFACDVGYTAVRLFLESLPCFNLTKFTLANSSVNGGQVSEYNAGVLGEALKKDNFPLTSLTIHDSISDSSVEAIANGVAENHCLTELYGVSGLPILQAIGESKTMAHLGGKYTMDDAADVIDAVTKDICFLGFTPGSLPPDLENQVHEIVKDRSPCEPNPNCGFKDKRVCDLTNYSDYHDDDDTGSIALIFFGSAFGAPIAVFCGLVGCLYCYDKFKDWRHSSSSNNNSNRTTSSARWLRLRGVA